jgi:hypothetical protein
MASTMHPAARDRVDWPGGRAAARRISEVAEGAGKRLVGPGGYYNVGNAIGLAMGIGLQVGAAPGREMQGAASAAWDYLAGNSAAVALTLATAVFFWSGEAYHRAWAHGAPPNDALNRRGDLLSGIGALILGVALLSLGQVVLALTAGLLHAVGKFGSAWRWRSIPGWPSDWPNLYRSAVLASRVPAIIAASYGLLWVLGTFGPFTPWSALVTPLTLLVCYLLWCRADLMLLGGSDEPVSDPVPAARPSV